MIRIVDKHEMIGRAFAYAERNFGLKQERDIFMQGVKFVAKRVVWK